MSADIIKRAYTEHDQYADEVTSILGKQGLLSDEEEMKQYLRGW